MNTFEFNIVFVLQWIFNSKLYLNIETAFHYFEKLQTFRGIEFQRQNPGLDSEARPQRPQKTAWRQITNMTSFRPRNVLCLRRQLRSFKTLWDTWKR